MIVHPQLSEKPNKYFTRTERCYDDSVSPATVRIAEDAKSLIILPHCNKIVISSLIFIRIRKIRSTEIRPVPASVIRADRLSLRGMDMTKGRGRHFLRLCDGAW